MSSNACTLWREKRRGIKERFSSAEKFNWGEEKVLRKKGERNYIFFTWGWVPVDPSITRTGGEWRNARRS